MTDYLKVTKILLIRKTVPKLVFWLSELFKNNNVEDLLKTAKTDEDTYEIKKAVFIGQHNDTCVRMRVKFEIIHRYLF